MERPLKKATTTKAKYVSVAKVVPDKIYHTNTQHVIDAYNEKGVSRSLRPDKVLRMECSLKNLAQTGVRDVLMVRLEKHDRGLSVITREHLDKRSNLVNVSELVFFEEKQPAPTYGSGEMQLLGLPHDIIRTKILPYLSNDSSLISLLFTCKFLHADALHYIRWWTKKCFKNEAATPMALSCFFKIRGWSTSRLERVFTIRLRQLEDKSMLENSAMEAIFQKYGSLEGWIESRKKKAELKLLKEEERLVIRDGIPRRFAEVQKYIESMGLPPLFESVDLEGDEFILTPIGQIYKHYSISNYRQMIRAREYVILNGFKKIQTIFGNNTREEIQFAARLMCMILEQENFKFCTIRVVSVLLAEFYYMSRLSLSEYYRKMTNMQLNTLLGWIVQVAATPNASVLKSVIVYYTSLFVAPQLYYVGNQITFGDCLQCIPELAKENGFQVICSFDMPETRFGMLVRDFNLDQQFNKETLDTSIKFDKLVMLCINDIV